MVTSSSMNHANQTGSGLPSVINPSMMNGNGGAASEKKQKAGKVTLDKNGKPKRKKASRGRSAAKKKLIVACQSCQKAHLTCDDGIII